MLPKRKVAAAAGATAVLGFMAMMGAGPTAPPGGAEEAPTGEANIWIEDGAGTCAGGRSATPITYEAAASPDRICDSWDAAWDAMNAGDTARVVAGDHDPQWLTGDKASTTFIIGASISTTFIGKSTNTNLVCDGNANDTAFCVDGDNLWLQDVTINIYDHHGSASASHVRNGENVTFKNVNLWGDFPALGVESPGFTWQDGTWGDLNAEPVGVCSIGSTSLPVTIESTADNATLDGITFHRIELEDGNPCDAHLEEIRLEGASDGFTLMNSRFAEESAAGSGHIFCGGVGGASNVRLINNYIPAVEGNFWTQCGEGESGWYYAYNTITQAGAPPTDGSVWVGNLGVAAAYPGCSAGTHVKNVWGGSGSCGTDTFVGATDIGVTEATGKLEGGSPAIDAAETPGASDHCTDAATVNSVDFEGTVRPQGSVCDAGADEST